MSQAGKQVADGVTQLIQGQRDIDKAETEYQSKLAEFNAQKPEAERQITLAEEKIDNLTVPAYSVSGRREGLTSQGYRVYMVIEGIVAKLADIFPIFLYFVAALVTFSTMGRMVDEERTNSGTLKALGYGNADVMLKFTVYGFAASTLGTCIGVLAGHTLLPLIVAHAYSAGFTMPDIMLKFHPWIHHGRIRTCMDKRRRAGMAGRVQGTARKTGEPTAAQAAGQRLENSFGTFPTTMEPSEFHTQSDRP